MLSLICNLSDATSINLFLWTATKNKDLIVDDLNYILIKCKFLHELSLLNETRKDLLNDENYKENDKILIICGIYDEITDYPMNFITSIKVEDAIIKIKNKSNESINILKNI